MNTWQPSTLQRLIDGALALLAGDADIQTMQPYHAAAVQPIEAARAPLAEHVAAFLQRVHCWHQTKADERELAEHAALVVSLGAGKSMTAREALPLFIARLKAAGLPHRVLWTVPTHRLGGEALEKMDTLGLRVAVMRGRDADDPDATEPGTKMCSAPDAVADAIAIGADVEKAVCGNSDGECCPFHRACAYQRQKTAVAAADVVIAAHNVMFHRLPKIATQDLALTIIDESWWQTGLDAKRETKLSSFAEDLFGHPVLRGFDGKKRRRPKGAARRQAADEAATSSLHELAVKAQHAFEATAQGELVSREAAECAGLTADDCALARQLEWRRKQLDVLRPGMSPEARKEAVALAAVNATLPRRGASGRHCKICWRAVRRTAAGWSSGQRWTRPGPAR